MAPSAPPTSDALLSLFETLADEVAGALADQRDWGGSGERDDQYALDVVADEIITPRLLAAGVGVLTEEFGHRPAPAGGVTVVVDPVDGSTNASLGLPWFATSLCAIDSDGPLVSLVANLATGDRWRAVRGQGVEVSAPTRPSSTATRLADAIVAVSGLPPAHGGWRQFRALGACALDLCAVATGGLDAYVDVDDAHGVWDYLGAVLVCTEAGVAVDDAFGRDLCVLDHGARRAPIAAVTPDLLDEVRAMRAGWR